MGCSQSKIDDQETVLRCDERKRFTKIALSSRNAFASAHSNFTVALKNMGAAFSDYSEGEVGGGGDHWSNVPPGVGVGGGSGIDGGLVTGVARVPLDPLPPPPPPLPHFPQLQRAATMPEISISIPTVDNKVAETIVEEVDEEEEARMSVEEKLERRPTRVKKKENVVEVEAPVPPLLPQVVAQVARAREEVNVAVPIPTQPEQEAYDYFFALTHEYVGASMSEPPVVVQGEKDVDVSNVVHVEKLKSVERMDEAPQVVEKDTDTVYEELIKKVEKKLPEKVVVEEREPELKTMKNMRQISREEVISSREEVIMNNVVDETPEPSKLKEGSKFRRNLTLLHIMKELDELFLKASQSAYKVSKLLEANRLHYHSNFADNQGLIDHSTKLIRVITWNKSIGGLREGDVGNDYVDPNQTLATVLDKLLAWEKKLCDEVKASELLKQDYERKVTSMRDKERRGTKNIEALKRTKAAVSHLHTRLIIDIQTMDSTVLEITSLRDNHLYPQLVILVDGLAEMWGTINLQHRGQMKIVEDIKFLDISQAPKETSEDHHKRTIQLWNAVEDWNTHFRRVITHKKEYISALNSWLKLSLVPIENTFTDRRSSPPGAHRPPIQYLLLSWQEHLQKLPDSVAGTSLASFAAVIELIVVQQQDELKLKRKWEETNKELNRKMRQFEDWYHKYMQKRTPPDQLSGDSIEKDPVADKKVVIDTLRTKLKLEVEAHQRHCMQVREKALGSLKTRLPELFRDMADFSSACFEMYKKLGYSVHAQKMT